MAGKPKAATKAELQNEVASVLRDPMLVHFMGIMSAEDDTLATRGGAEGLKIYDDLERDAHLYAVVQKRKMAVVSYEWDVDPASEKPRDEEAAKLVKDTFKALNFDEMTLNLLDALLKGYAVGEIVWKPDGSHMLPVKFIPRKQRRFVFDTDYRPRLLTEEHMVEGEPLPDRKLLVHSYGSKDANPYGLGLGTRLFWPVFFKKKGITFWLVFLDRFASPTPKGAYPRGATQKEIDELKAALAAIANGGGIVHPDGMLIELLESARTGIDSYEKLCRYMDEEISKCVLGETLTTNIEGGGSRAAAQVHDDIRIQLAKADADLLSALFNETLVRWIIDLNMPGAGYPTVWRNVAEPEDRQATALYIKTMGEAGYQPNEETLVELVGDGWIRGEKLEPSEEPKAETPKEDAPAFAAPQDPPPTAEVFAENAGQEAVEAMGDFLDPLAKLAQKAESLEELQRLLVEEYGNLNPVQLADLLERAMLAAEMAGRYEAQEDTQ